MATEFYVEAGVGLKRGRCRWKVMALFDDGCTECVDDFGSEREAERLARELNEELAVDVAA